MLPTKFRLIMYLDVFGWINRAQQRQALGKTDGDYVSMVSRGKDVYSPCHDVPQASLLSSPGHLENPLTCTVTSRDRLIDNVRETLQSWQSEDALHSVDEFTKHRLGVLVGRFRALDETLPELLPPLLKDFDAKADPVDDDHTPRSGAVSLTHSVSEPDRELSVVSEPETQAGLGLHCYHEEILSPMRTRIDSSGKRLVTGSYCTDFGTEVPYEYAASSQAPTSPSPSLPTSPQLKFTPGSHSRCRSLSRLNAGGAKLRSLSAAEEELEKLEELRVLSSADFKNKKAPCDDNDATGTSAGRAFLRSPRRNGKELLRISKQRAARAAPWLFADVEERPELSFPSTDPGIRRHDSADCSHKVGNMGGETRGLWAEQHGPAPDAGDTQDLDAVVVAAEDKDKLPWQVFRHATLLLVFVWLISPCLLYGFYPFGRSEFGPRRPTDWQKAETQGKSFAEKEDPDGTFSGMVIDNRDMDFDLEPTIEDYESMPTLPEGQYLDVAWPFESSFTPRALTCDDTGTHLAVSDDFGVFAGRVVETSDGTRVQVEKTRTLFDLPGSHTPQSNLDKDARQLRGLLRKRAAATRQPPSFAQMPHCTALEGKEIKDVSVVCSSDKNHLCRVLVLHSNGRRLTECPLYTSWGTLLPPETLNRALSTPDVWGPMPDRAVVRPLSEWKISGSWLEHDHETIESLAVNPDCEQQEEQPAEHAFDPAEVGCVVVGTSSGRVVQLRRHASKAHDLVPEWAMQEKRGKVSSGSLQIFPGGFVLMLRSEIGLMQAINAAKGSLLGQWRMPADREWYALGGGGKSLFMLGRDRTEEKRVSLWKFPLPPELAELFTAYADKGRIDKAVDS